MKRQKSVSKERILAVIEEYPGIRHKELARKVSCTMSLLTSYMIPIIDSGDVVKHEKYDGYRLGAKARMKSLFTQGMNIARQSA